MHKKLLNFKGIDFEADHKENNSSIENIPQKDIAVIGISGKFAGNSDLEEFWDMLVHGKDGIRAFPKKRRQDVEEYLRCIGVKDVNVDYHVGGFLEEIDKFDSKFFSISPREANLMDPNQKLFLETVWNAIEDAGYGGKKLYGTKTSVYLGYSTDFGEEYKKFIQAMDPDAAKISVTGNIKSIISSRVSYILNLLGPSIVVDTACSSGLVSVHLACRSIRSGECDIAIAGGVKVFPLPIKSDGETKWGIQIVDDIESSSGKTKTFDDDSDGTVIGEGVSAIILKSLGKAIEDKDNIYAVIKGSAINQDGSSIGITAPNSRAQEEVICAAWKDAGIDPETISYIEAHGTGTKLGDPVEISGIQRAFKHYTDKKQFCSIGTVKANIGHLDSTAGMSGLVKAILSLYNKQLPPTINFNKPNQKIDFVESPIYVNDLLRDWETEGTPRRCGVSSFGLSGTNCHIVLQEAPCRKIHENVKNGLEVLSLSAKSKETLDCIIRQYIDFLGSEHVPSLANICFTANTGRGHYGYRVAIIAMNLEELKHKLVQISDYAYTYNRIENVFYGCYKVVQDQKKFKDLGEITEDEKRNICSQADSRIQELLSLGVTEERLRGLCSLYIKGADVEWDYFYKNASLSRVRLPSYPFEKTRHWVERSFKIDSTQSQSFRLFNHPLIDVCLVKSMNLEVYKTGFNVDKHWVLGEHKVLDRYVVPGTTYIEMVSEIFKRNYSREAVELNNIVFLSPLSVEKSETKETHIISKNNGEYIEFTVASKDTKTDSWTTHMEGKALLNEPDDKRVIDLEELMCRFEVNKPLEYGPNPVESVTLGQRWNNYKKVYEMEGEYFAHIQLQDAYIDDLTLYGLHPALMDCAINTANPDMKNGFYLPFCYKKLKIYGDTPKSFYSYLKRKDILNQNGETAVFDVVFMDDRGNIFVEAQDYTIKKVRIDEFKMENKYNNVYHQINWVQKEIPKHTPKLQGATALVFKDNVGLAQGVISKLIELGKRVIEVDIGDCFCKLSEDKYSIGSNQEDYTKLLKELALESLPLVIHLSTFDNDFTIENLEQLEESQGRGLYSLYYLVRAMVSNKLVENSTIILISDYAGAEAGTSNRVKPHNASMIGLAKVVKMEHPKLTCRVIDIDKNTTINQLMEELMVEKSPFTVAYRDGQRYLEELGTMNIAPRWEHTDVKKDGAYIVTGGTGALGLEVSKFLVSKAKVKIGLISRTCIPDRSQWNETTDRKFLEIINSIRKIESMGSEVVAYSANVGNYNEMESVLDNFRNKFGRIDGIVHCAGVAGDGFIFRKDETAFKSVILPKINGTWVLERLTREDNLDFFVMFSSVASVIHIAGQGDYTAANCYMDAFASYMNKSGRNAVAINWPPWKEVGMAVAHNLDVDKGAFMPVTNAEARRLLENIIISNAFRVIVGNINSKYFEPLKDYYLINEGLKLSTYQNKPSIQESISPERNNGVIITGKNEETLSEIECTVSKVWARTLRLDKIDIYDSFNTMGGDSLMATALIKEMEIVYPGVIDITDVFTYPTIADMSEYIEKKVKKEEQTDILAGNLTLSQIVDMLTRNEITIEESDKMIKELEKREIWQL